MKNKLLISLVLSIILFGCSSSTKTGAEGPENGPENNTGTAPKIFENFETQPTTWGIKE